MGYIGVKFHSAFKILSCPVILKSYPEVISVFGFDPVEHIAIKMPYFTIKDSTICEDDPTSNYYNQIIDESKISRPDWNTREPMRSTKDYRWGIVINYNKKPPIPKRGSCVFLHIGNPSSGTAGCTAMSEFRLKKLIYWLKRNDNPVLVQLTKSNYQQLRSNWNLP